MEPHPDYWAEDERELTLSRDWQEKLHPRILHGEHGGQFMKKGTLGPGGKAPPKPTRVGKAQIEYPAKGRVQPPVTAENVQQHLATAHNRGPAYGAAYPGHAAMTPEQMLAQHEHMHTIGTSHQHAGARPRPGLVESLAPERQREPAKPPPRQPTPTEVTAAEGAKTMATAPRISEAAAAGAAQAQALMENWRQDWVPPRPGGWVPDLTPAPGVKDLTSPGRPDGTGTADDPIDVQGNLNRALHLMHQGKHVRLNQPSEVALLLKRVEDLSRRGEGPKGKANWDFGLLTVKGTNLFTAQTKGIPRIDMPQFSGLAEPGSPAAKMAGGDGKFVDLTDDLAKVLDSEGIKVEEKRVPAAHLRATQTELVGAKVAGFANAVRAGNEKAKAALEEPIYVTRDNYVVDGHHRWAANMMLDALDGVLGNDSMQNVRVIDMDIGAMIPYANAYAQRMGIAGRGGVKKATRALITRARLDGPDEADRAVLRLLMGLDDTPGPWRVEIAKVLTGR